MPDAGVGACSSWSVSGRSSAPFSADRRASPSRISPSATNSGCFSARSADPDSRAGTASSGSGCHGSGRVGARASSSSSPRPSSPGTARASGSTGAGGPPRTASGGRGLTPRSVGSSAAWRARIRRGAGGASGRSSLLGYEVAELTVAKYMRRTSPRPSPTWRAFLAAHLREMVAVDFFVVPTLTCRLLFVFVVLRHDRRELLHLNVTDHPTAAGRPSSSSRRSRGRPPRDISCAIAMRSTGSGSPAESKPWGSAK